MGGSIDVRAESCRGLAPESLLDFNVGVEALRQEGSRSGPSGRVAVPLREIGPDVLASRDDLVCRSRAAALAFGLSWAGVFLDLGRQGLRLLHWRVLNRGEAYPLL